MIGLPQPAFPLPAASSANMGSAQPYLLKPRSLFCSYQPFPKHPCSSLTCLFLPITNPIELGFFSATLKVGFQESFLFSQWSSYCLFHRCSILPLWDVNYSGFWQLSSVSCIISIFSVSFLSVLVPASFRCLLSLDVYFHGGEKHKELTGSSVG